LRRSLKRRHVRSRKRQSDHVAALYAEREVLEHTVALGCRKRLLGKSRQQIRVWMRLLG
jgi:hypothetical protein